METRRPCTIEGASTARDSPSVTLASHVSGKSQRSPFATRSCSCVSVWYRSPARRSHIPRLHSRPSPDTLCPLATFRLRKRRGKSPSWENSLKFSSLPSLRRFCFKYVYAYFVYLFLLFLLFYVLLFIICEAYPSKSTNFT